MDLRKNAGTLLDVPPRSLKVLSLYFLETDANEVIRKNYSSDCEFHDPLVSVYGIDNVIGQFRSLQGIMRSCRAEYYNSHMNRQTNVLTIESSLFFNPKLWYFGELEIRIFTTCQLDEYGKIKMHTDHWSMASLVQTLPIISRLYNAWRYVFGTTTSKVVNVISKVAGLIKKDEKSMKEKGKLEGE